MASAVKTRLVSVAAVLILLCCHAARADDAADTLVRLQKARKAMDEKAVLEIVRVLPKLFNASSDENASAGILSDLSSAALDERVEGARIEAVRASRLRRRPPEEGGDPRGAGGPSGSRGLVLRAPFDPGGTPCRGEPLRRGLGTLRGAAARRPGGAPPLAALRPLSRARRTHGCGRGRATEGRGGNRRIPAGASAPPASAAEHSHSLRGRRRTVRARHATPEATSYCGFAINRMTQPS